MFLVLHCSLLAQNSVTVKGVVKGEDGFPIPGVTVLVQGTTRGAVTDFDGNYSVVANVGSTIVFSYIGMQSQSLKVTGNQLNVILKEDVSELSEVVVIGYGTQKKKEITGAVSQVKAEDIEQVITSDISNALQGQIAGVNVSATSGEPGESAGILIRGVSSLTGSNSPLYVVDGVPQSNGDPGLNPNEIETIDVLKDAASASIYGTRAAGGVILITTKKGKAGNTKIGIDMSNGIQIITRETPLMDTNEQIFFDARNPRLNSLPAAGDRFSLLNNNDLRDFTNNDLAEVNRYNFNISGGLDDINYSLTAGYFSQEATVVNSTLKRYNMRGNVTLKKNKLTFDNGFGFTIDERLRPSFLLLWFGQQAAPYLDEVSPNTQSASNDTDDSQTGSAFQRVLEALTQTNEASRYRFEANTNIKYQINKNLEFSTLLAGTFTNEANKIVQPPFELYDANGANLRPASESFVFEARSRNVLLNFNAGLNYSNKFGDHNFEALALINLEQDYYTSIGAVTRGLLFPDTPTLSSGSILPTVGSQGNFGLRGVPNNINNPDYRIKRIGSIGRVQYNYDERYLLSLSGRVDASSQFSSDNLYAFFPSASIGWNISDEKFWKINTINSLKLRASIGTTGNDRFEPNSKFNQLAPQYDANLGDTQQPGLIQDSFGNSDVKWEVTVQRNLGLDVSLLKNKISVTADYYLTDKNDLLAEIQVPASFGASVLFDRDQIGSRTAVVNVGSMTNKGFETSIRYRPKTGNVRWNILGTFSTNKNVVTNIESKSGRFYFPNNLVFSDPNSQMVGLVEGREAGAFLVYETDGIFTDAADVAAYNALYGQTKVLGDRKFVDSDGDGVLFSANDRVYKGSGLPDYEVGLNINANYKNWYFATNWYASVGNEVINATKAFAYRSGRHKDLLYQYIPGVNEDTSIPNFPSNFDNSINTNYSSLTDVFIEDGSFLRLRNVVVAYTLPKEVSKKIGFDSLNIFANAQNILTITNYTGLDPEVGGNSIEFKGVDRGLIPVSASVNLGLRLNF
jgi:TonB-linked SusC/RagA family outer membrane protein